MSSDPLLRYQPPGMEWTPPGQAPASCPVCGTPYADAYVAGSAQFCESCGAERPGPAPLPEGAAATLDPDVALLPARPCVQCGGDVDSDGYCTVCGAKAQSERDHFREEPADWVAGVCDRGIRHQRNEDAMALAAAPDPGSRAVLVVCDGVSSSIDSDVASLAGAEAARDLLWANQPQGVGTPESHRAAMTAALEQAATAANDAVIEKTDPQSTNAASATFAAAVVQNGQVFVANLGDSRVYWIPDGGDGAQLTVDDSVAQARIETGVPREEAENGEGAHAITKWLGRDAPDLEPRVADLAPQEDGWVVVCSDGLWNYASGPADVTAVLRAALDTEPRPTGLVEVGERMVAWANEQGGKDNVTVALARIGTPVTYRAAEPDTAETGPSPTQDAPPKDAAPAQTQTPPASTAGQGSDSTATEQPAPAAPMRGERSDARPESSGSAPAQDRPPAGAPQASPEAVSQTSAHATADLRDAPATSATSGRSEGGAPPPAEVTAAPAATLTGPAATRAETADPSGADQPSGSGADGQATLPAPGQEHPLDGTPTRRTEQCGLQQGLAPRRPAGAPADGLVRYPPVADGTASTSAPAAPVWQQPQPPTAPAAGSPSPQLHVRGPATGDLQPYPGASSRPRHEGSEQPRPPAPASDAGSAPGGAQEMPPTTPPPPAPSAATGTDQTHLTPFPGAELPDARSE